MKLAGGITPFPYFVLGQLWDYHIANSYRSNGIKLPGSRVFEGTIYSELARSCRTSPRRTLREDENLVCFLVSKSPWYNQFSSGEMLGRSPPGDEKSSLLQETKKRVSKIDK